jgi:hypothetical protein
MFAITALVDLMFAPQPATKSDQFKKQAKIAYGAIHRYEGAAGLEASLGRLAGC